MPDTHSRSVHILSFGLCYLMLAVAAVTLWLSWLAGHTTSVPIGLGALLLLIQACIFAMGSTLLILISTQTSKERPGTPAHEMTLMGSAISTVILSAGTIASAFAQIIAGGSEGFLRSITEHFPTLIMAVVTLVSALVWVTALATTRLGARHSQAHHTRWPTLPRRPS